MSSFLFNHGDLRSYPYLVEPIDLSLSQRNDNYLNFRKYDLIPEHMARSRKLDARVTELEDVSLHLVTRDILNFIGLNNWHRSECRVLRRQDHSLQELKSKEVKRSRSSLGISYAYTSTMAQAYQALGPP